MQSLHQIEIVIMLLAVVLVLTTIARKILIPYPILLVIGGLVLGVVPGLPTVTLDPNIVFLVFLPPILWAAAYLTSLREFRANLRPILLLAVGLVLATTAAVAVVAHAVLPGIGWAEAIALGAIVSPPDAVSATAIGKRLRIGPEEGDWYTVVGIVGDVKRSSLEVEAPDAIYVTPEQWHWVDNLMSLVVRSSGDAAALAPAVRRAVWSVDKDQPIVRVATMTQLVDRAVADRRFPSSPTRHRDRTAG